MTTDIDISLVIAACSLLFAIFSGVVAMKRNEASDNKKDASEHTTVIVKLENIAEGISDIKSDMKNMKADYKELRGMVIRADESTKQAHKRLDDFKTELEELKHRFNCNE